MTVATLDPGVAQRLRGRAARLTEGAQGLARVDGLLLFGVPAWVCRAYVWAEHNRTDPVRAVARAHYGREGEAFVAGNVACGIVRHARAMTRRCAEVAERLAQP